MRAPTNVALIGTTAYVRVLRHRALSAMVISHGIATVAQQVVVLGAGAFVLSRTDSPVWTSITVALGYAPYLLLSAHAGALADRHSRATVMRWSVVVRAVLTGLLALAMLLNWSTAAVVALIAAIAVAATPGYPSLAAAGVQCVDDEDLPTANALTTGVENIAWVVGPGALGAVLLLGFGPAEAVAAAAALFLVAGLALIRVVLPLPEVAEGELLEGVWPVVRATVRIPEIRVPMLIAVIDNILYGYVIVALVLLVADQGSDRRLGMLTTALSVGAIVSLAVVDHVAGRRRPTLTLFALAAVFAGCVIVLGVSGASPVAIGVIAVAVAGVATVLIEVLCVTQLQRATPESTHGRVIGMYDVVAVGAVAAGSLLAGVATNALGVQTATIVVGAGCLVLAAVSVGLRAGTPSPAPS
jgi:MFS family permease